MTAERSITREEYIRAFETWASVAELTDDERDDLTRALAAFRALPDDGVPVPVADLCREATPLIEDARGLGLSIHKSCLLHRLVYLGEPLRTERCPVHGGEWSGLSPVPCPHGCDATCGCRTGWLSVKGDGG